MVNCYYICKLSNRTVTFNIVTHINSGNKKFEFQISPQASVNDLCNQIERETGKRAFSVFNKP